MAELVDAAEEFAAVLTEVVNGTISTGVQFVVTPLADRDLAWVYPDGSTPAAVRLVPVTAGLDDDQESMLWIKTMFQVRLDQGREHLAVEQSVFALVVNEYTGRPAIRIEYDRDRGSEPDDEAPGQHRRSAAHVQIHGASEELAYVQGLNRENPVRGLERFHIPVGGRRFRPSLEDFIEFLFAERLIPTLNDGWQHVLSRHRSEFLSRQLRAAVRNDPTSAAEQLERMGYSVVGPRGDP